MNENFLSRGKREDNGEWVTGYCVLLGDKCHYICTGKLIITNNVPTFEHFYVIPETVGRCTGLTDKNGKMIFEGDIIKLGGHKFKFIKANGYELVVKFDKCGGVQNVDYEVGYIGFYVTPIGKDAKLLLDVGVRTDILYWLNAYEVSVIGNIHDNPELIGTN